MSVFIKYNKQGRPWCLPEKNLILLVQQYPVTYQPFTTKRPTKIIKAKWDIAWAEIASELNLPVKTCKQLWTDTKFRYAKLMILINTGIIAKEDAISHPETERFFDGQLSFLDPFITEITDADIPHRVHKYINDILAKQTQNIVSTQNCTQFVTHGQVKALIAKRELTEGTDPDSINTEYLQNVVYAAIKRKLEELQLINNSSELINNSTQLINNSSQLINNSSQLINNSSSIPNIDVESNINATVITRKNILEISKSKPSLGLESELIIEDDIKIENEVVGIDENLTLDNNIKTNRQIVKPMNILNDQSNVIEHNDHDIEMADNNDETTISDDYIRKFFMELGEVMSIELSLSKQKMLRSRINELVKSLLLQSQEPSSQTTQSTLRQN